QFINTLRIFPTNTIVNIYNTTHLKALNSLAFTILATNDPPNIKAANYTNIGNLYNRFSLVISNRIILIKNL
ncbi:hypothetical protein QBC45DRAFT_340025, partial [Copromyces sp. CBS 386.78]